eukprot:SAG31_NODE_4081_length_3608_cov_3.369336_1_plen_136_part_00
MRQAQACRALTRAVPTLMVDGNADMSALAAAFGEIHRRSQLSLPFCPLPLALNARAWHKVPPVRLVDASTGSGTDQLFSMLGGMAAQVQAIAHVIADVTEDQALTPTRCCIPQFDDSDGAIALQMEQLRQVPPRL